MTVKRSSNDNRPPAPTWLRRADQAVVATLVALSLLIIAGVWVSKGGLRHQLIDIDRSPSTTIEFQVDLNGAEWPELAQLPDVGETLARRIVESRVSEGPFVDLDDLLRVNGIGPKTLEKVRPYLMPMPPDEAIVDEREIGGNG